MIVVGPDHLTCLIRPDAILDCVLSGHAASLSTIILDRAGIFLSCIALVISFRSIRAQGRARKEDRDWKRREARAHDYERLMATPIGAALDALKESMTEHLPVTVDEVRRLCEGGKSDERLREEADKLLVFFDRELVGLQDAVTVAIARWPDEPCTRALRGALESLQDNVTTEIAATVAQRTAGGVHGCVVLNIAQFLRVIREHTPVLEPPGSLTMPQRVRAYFTKPQASRKEVSAVKDDLGLAVGTAPIGAKPGPAEPPTRDDD